MERHVGKSYPPEGNAVDEAVPPEKNVAMGMEEPPALDSCS